MSLRRAFSAMPVTVVAAACAALAAVSLLGPHQPTYDPWAWLLWGREIAHGHLDTVAGPSWKPLPVVFTTPLSLLGGAAPPLWLMIARTGFLLGVAAAFALAASLAGRAAGAVAALGVVLVDRFTSLSARGDSEGILMGLSLGAIVLHRAGRRRDAVLLALAACLVRPEVWPFAGAYVLWLLLARADPALRPRLAAGAIVCGLVIVAAWFVPEQLGSGRLLRGASRAREPVAGSPAQSAVPFLAVFGNAAGSLPIPFYVGGVVAVGLAARARRSGANGFVLLLAAAATLYMVIVGVLAQAGFTGNQRYVLLPASVVCVLGAVGLVWGARALEGRGVGRWALAVAALASLALTIGPARRFVRQLRGIQHDSALYDDLGPAIDRAGGPDAVRRCGPVFTDMFQTQAVMWRLDLSGAAVKVTPRPPGTIVAPGWTAVAADTRFPHSVVSGSWTVRSTCALPPGR